MSLHLRKFFEECRQIIEGFVIFKLSGVVVREIRVRPTQLESANEHRTQLQLRAITQKGVVPPSRILLWDFTPLKISFAVAGPLAGPRKVLGICIGLSQDYSIELRKSAFTLNLIPL